MKLVGAAGLATLLNTFTTPPCCTTNQRELSPGACSRATGLENDSELNTRCEVNDALDEGAAPATQLVLLGRASRPEDGSCAACVVAFTAVDSPETFAGVAASNARSW
jgi:hypothetical protein